MVRSFKRTAFIAQYYTKKSYFALRQRAPKLLSLHFKSFPAVHISKMDGLDFVFKFGSELLVLAIIALGALTNLYFFAGSNGKSFADNSLNAKFLNNHGSQNPQLYARNNSIITKVARGGFVPQAYAETGFAALNADQTAQEDMDTTGVSLDEDNNSFVQPNADSVAAMISKQIKVYQTQPGDTLGSIARANNLSINTIIWANNLPGTTIKPGWYLRILPTDGIVHQADDNDTLMDIATYYNPEKYNSNKKVRDEAAAQLLEKIISYNMLANAEDIEPGDIFIVPGGALVQKPEAKPAPKPRTSTSGKVNAVGVVQPKIVNNGNGHIFPWGYCTWYVATRTHVPWGGNAKNWLANAKAYGAVVNSTPAPGTIVVTTDNRYYGHVAYVEKVEDDKILISEMNYEKFGKVNQRWLSTSSKTIRGYIYP